MDLQTAIYCFVAFEKKKCNAVANSAPNHINLQCSVAKNGPPKNIINIKSNIIEYLETFF